MTLSRIHFSLAAILLASASIHAQSTFRGNNARTGVYASTPLRTLPDVLWRFKSDGPILSSPVLSKGILFFGSNDTFLYAIDQSTGKLKWKFETSGPIPCTPAVANGRVYFSSYDGNFYAVDEDTGKLKWKFAMKYERRFQAKHLHGQEPKEQMIPDAWDFYLSSPAVESGNVYFGSGDGNVYCLSTQDGKLLWNFQTGNVVHGSPALAEGLVYIGGFDSRLYALDQKTGRRVWSYQAGLDPENHNQEGFQSSPCIANGTVYIGCRDSHIYAIDAKTGKQKWAFKTNDTAWASDSPAALGGTIFEGTRPLFGIDATSGRKLFEAGAILGVFSSPAVTEDTLYFGSLNGRIYGVDAKTGDVLWEFLTDAAKADPLHLVLPNGKWNVGNFPSVFYDFQDDYLTMYRRFSVGAVVSSPLAADGKLYCGSADGCLYALGSGS